MPLLKSEIGEREAELGQICKRIVDHLGAMVAYWDKDQVCRFANMAYLDWFGISSEELIDKKTLKELLGKLYPQNMPFIDGVLKGIPQQFEREIVVPSGELRHSLANYIPDKRDGVVVGFFVHVTDVSHIKKLEQRLNVTEEKYKLFFEKTPDAQLVINQKGEVIIVNDQIVEVFGFSKKEIIGESLELLFASEHKESQVWKSLFDLTVHKIIPSGTNLEFFGRHRSGDVFPIEISLNSIELGLESWLSVSIKDISQRRRAERDLDEMATIIATSTDAIITKKIDGTILSWNKAAEDIFGYKLSEVKGKNISIVYPPDLLEEESLLIKRLMAGQKISQYETVRLRKDKTLIQVSISLSAIKNKHGEIVGVSNILRDITLNKYAEAALKLAYEQYKTFVTLAPNGIVMLDENLRYLAASQKWLELNGLTHHNVTGKTVVEVFKNIDDTWKSNFKKCLEGEVLSNEDELIVSVDGSFKHVKWEMMPWFREEKVAGVILSMDDITLPKLREREAIRQKFLNILQKSQKLVKLATWEVDAFTGIANWDSMANEIFDAPEGYEPLPEKVMDLYVRGKNFENLMSAVVECKERGTPYDLEAEIITFKGNHKWLRITGEAEFLGGVCLRRYGLIQDITLKKVYEGQIVKINEELNAILNSGHVSIIGTDINGTITHFNHGAEKLLKYNASELVGKRNPEMFYLQEELERRRKELLDSMLDDVSGFNVLVVNAIRGEYEAKEWTYVRKDGKMFPVQSVITCIRDAVGNGIIGYLIVSTDITEIKNVERELKAVVDVTKSQNDRLRNFAHIVSHNLRSHSANIEIMLDMYLQQNPSLKDDEMIAHLKKSCGGLKETILNLNEVVQINTSNDLKFVKIDLKERIDVVCANLYSLAQKESVDIKIDPSVNTNVLGIVSYVDSILLNMISNAIKYKGEGREAFVEIGCEVEDGWVVVKIQDNGLGIDLKKHMSKLFGMYKTFHGHKESRGIGLFITKNQIEAMDGRVEVESEVNVGTTFKIYLKYGEN